MWVFGDTDSRRGDDSEINTSAKTDVESKWWDDSVESTCTKDLEAGFSFFAPLLSAAPSSSYSECKNNRECVKIKKKKKRIQCGGGAPAGRTYQSTQSCCSLLIYQCLPSDDIISTSHAHFPSKQDFARALGCLGPHGHMTSITRIRVKLRLRFRIRVRGEAM